MRCPRCAFEGELVGGRCGRCGYGLSSASPVASPAFFARADLAVSSRPISTSSKSPIEQPLVRGTMLHRGRYRLVEPFALPENQQVQGKAWLAIDGQSQRRVVIREVIPPQGSFSDKEQAIRSVVVRLTELSQHPGFPRVIDAFSEQGSHYIVLEQGEGESLAILLQRQGGALPERSVVEYGRQVCEMLALLSQLQPPVVHGSISPETLIVSPDRSRVSLIHVPLFPIQDTSKQDKTQPGYIAPEQLRGTLEPSSDLYSLAATLHHAVTGYDPRERIAFFHPPARRLNPAVTAGMESILSQELRLSTSQRYARAFDMQKDLSALLTSYPPPSEELSLPQSLPVSLSLDTTQMRRRSRNRDLLSASVLGIVTLLVLASFILVLIHPFPGVSPGSTNRASSRISTQNATATSIALALAQQNATRTAQEQVAFNKELLLEAQTFQKKGIGMSDGRYVFDLFPGRFDLLEKNKAAQALQKGDMSSASSYLGKAVSEDPTDGEAQIYYEDLQILQSGAPSVTLVLGLPIDNSSNLSFDRPDMESAYLVQHEINSGNVLPNGLKLRILIDSSGGDDANVGTVAQFITNRVADGNPDHILAVVGWPFSSETKSALSIIAGAHIPLVSQTASSVKLSGASPYFFRVNPPDDLQGSTLGSFAVTKLTAKTILVMRDPADTYSNSLADAFSKSTKALGATPLNNPNDYFTEGTTTDYQQVINDVETTHADLIFLAGLDVDAIRLAHAVGVASRLNPTNARLANLQILGGDAIDTGFILGQGNTADALLAANYPLDMRRLHFTAFGHPHEWTYEHVPQSQQPMFFSDWASIYQSSAAASHNAPDPGNDAMLTYDALRVILSTTTQIKGSLTGQAIRDALASLSKGKAYQGISGRILFDSNGNPVDKAVVVLDVGPDNTGNNAILLDQVVGQFFAK